MAAYKHRTGILLLIGGGGAALALLIYDGLSRNDSTGSEPRPVAPAASSASPTIPANAPEEAAPSVANDAPDTAREEPIGGSELVLFLEDVSGGALPPRDVRSARNIQAAGDAAADAALFERDTTGPAILSAPPRKADANAHAESTEPREFYPRPASAEALAGLTSAFRIECNFAEGIGFWGSIESLEPGDAYYRGDIIVYHTIDLDAGSARMTASLGVTGSQKGEIDVRVTATPLGLYFSHIEPTGRLAVTTVFGQLRADTVYRAVFSQQGAVDTYQFRGECAVF